VWLQPLFLTLAIILRLLWKYCQLYLLFIDLLWMIKLLCVGLFLYECTDFLYIFLQHNWMYKKDFEILCIYLSVLSRTLAYFVLISNLFLFCNIMFYNISVFLVKMHFYSVRHPLVLRKRQPRWTVSARVCVRLLLFIVDNYYLKLSLLFKIVKC